MTLFSDNLYTGFLAPTSAASSISVAHFRKTHRFTQPTVAPFATAQTQTGTFPPGTQNLSAALYILANSSATVSDKITVSAGGTNLLTITSFGSASGYFAGTTTGLGTVTVIASACANLSAPSPSTNGGEIPYSVTFLPVSASRGDYQLVLNFNRVDGNFPSRG